MEQQHTQRRGFDAIKVKENVVGVLFVSTIMGVVGFIFGLWKRIDDVDVQHRAVLSELKERVNHHSYQLEGIDEFHKIGPRFTLRMGEELRANCRLLQNDIDHWSAKIVENAQGLKEVRVECRNLINDFWEAYRERNANN